MTDYPNSSNTDAKPDGNTKKASTTEVRAPMKIWTGILFVYLFLFVATGYLAFFVEEYNPATNLRPETYMDIKDPETKTLIISTLKQDSETFQKKRELASQSFNVVLGALLGFLSASAVSRFSNSNDR